MQLALGSPGHVFYRAQAACLLTALNTPDCRTRPLLHQLLTMGKGITCHQPFPSAEYFRKTAKRTQNSEVI